METPSLHEEEKSFRQEWLDMVNYDEVDTEEQAFMRGYEEDAQESFKEGA